MKNKFKIGQVAYSPEHGFCKIVDIFGVSIICTISAKDGSSFQVTGDGYAFGDEKRLRPKVYPLTTMQAFAIKRLHSAGWVSAVELAEFWAAENGRDYTSRSEIGFILAATRCFKSLKSLGIVKVEYGDDCHYYELITPNT